MRPRFVVELVLLAMLWGTAYLFMRAAVPAFGPAPLVGLRVGIATLVLLPVLALRGGLGELRKHRRALLVLGSLYTALPFLLLAIASQWITAGFAAILNATSPLFAAIIGHLWLAERIGRLRAAGLVVGFAGVVVLVWGKASFAAGGAGLAIVSVLGASTLWGFGANYTRSRLAGANSVALATGSLLVASFVMAPFVVASWPAQPPGARAWAEMLFLGVGSSGIGFLMYFRLLEHVGAVRAMSVTFLNPVFAMLSGAVYLGESVTLQMLAGCAVILAGTALTLGLVGPARPAAGARIAPPAGPADN